MANQVQSELKIHVPAVGLTERDDVVVGELQQQRREDVWPAYSVDRRIRLSRGHARCPCED
jgi:hypothetical protein